MTGLGRTSVRRATVNRLLVVTAFGGAAVLSPVLAGSSQASAQCPAHALCIYPGPHYEGEPMIFGVPRSPFAKGQWLDDGHCRVLRLGSLIDNTIYGGTVYANNQCDNGGENQDFGRKARIADFTNWHVRSFIYPLDQDTTVVPAATSAGRTTPPTGA
jgi:peptidase inhibitor family I36